MAKTRFYYLFEQYFNDTATPAEIDEFLILSALPENAKELELLMKEKWENFTPESGPFDSSAKLRMLNVIQNSDDAEDSDRFKFPFWKKLSIAASITLIASSALFLYKNQFSSSEESNRLAKTTPIVPGKTGATLTLSDGRQIKLTGSGNGKLAQDAGIVITKSSTGEITYEIVDEPEAPALTNTLSTAKGETYKLKLPDGSLVWLNAASSLTYFTGVRKDGKRKVKLSGEGYFEVAKDKAHPFVVETEGQEVEVLGTHFNVKAYGDEKVSKTTLLEGLVKVNGSTYLKPGQQSVLKSNSLIVVDADGASETAWINGRFSFSGNDFKSIMHTISLWYNVDVVYEFEPVNLRLSGGISRFENIKDVLDLLQATGEIRFKVEGRRISVIR